MPCAPPKIFQAALGPHRRPVKDVLAQTAAEPVSKSGDNGQSPWQDTAMRLPMTSVSWKVLRLAAGLHHDGDSYDLRLQLARLFRRQPIAKARASKFLPAHQIEHSAAQNAASWQHASTHKTANSLACRCYGCSGRAVRGKI